MGPASLEKSTLSVLKKAGDKIHLQPFSGCPLESVQLVGDSYGLRNPAFR